MFQERKRGEIVATLRQALPVGQLRDKPVESSQAPHPRPTKNTHPSGTDQAGLS